MLYLLYNSSVDLCEYDFKSVQKHSLARQCIEEYMSFCGWINYAVALTRALVKEIMDLKFV